MKAIQTINGAATIIGCNEVISDKVFSMTGFNYGIHESQDNDGTTTVTFDCIKDAEKFVRLYNEFI
jgi:hypothetical protein